MSATTPRPAPSLLRRATKQKRLVFGVVLTLLIVALAVLGPLVAPHGQNEVVGPPFSGQGALGTDYLGQDVLSRLLHGGRSVLVIAVLGTALGMVLGVLIGVVAAMAPSPCTQPGKKMKDSAWVAAKVSLAP